MRCDKVPTENQPTEQGTAGGECLGRRQQRSERNAVISVKNIQDVI